MSDDVNKGEVSEVAKNAPEIDVKKSAPQNPYANVTEKAKAYGQLELLS